LLRCSRVVPREAHHLLRFRFRRGRKRSELVLSSNCDICDQFHRLLRDSIP
jgi:hypothetical protein